MAMGYLETLLGENCVLTAAWDLAVEHVRTPPFASVCHEPLDRIEKEPNSLVPE